MLRTTEDGNVINNKGFVNKAIKADDPRLMWLYPREMSREEGPWAYLVVQPDDEQAIPGTLDPYACIVEYIGKEAHITIPETLGGYKVREIFHKAFYSMQFVWDISMPDTVERIGMKAFAFCRSLKRLRMSDSVRELTPNVLLRCTAMRELHLPASLRELDGRVVADCPLEELEIPRDCKNLLLGHENLPKLKHLSVNPQNPWYLSDGDALYSRDGKTLIKMLRNVLGYRVSQGCENIAPDAFKSMERLVSIDLPEGLQTIGAYAFMRTGLVRVDFPSTLKKIGERAFSRCQFLRDVIFNEGLEEVGASAFASTAVQEVSFSANLRELGARAFEDAPVLYDTQHKFSIDPQNPHLKSDGDAVYCRREEGWYLADVISDVDVYQVPAGVVGVLRKAFAHNNHIRRVTFPAGLKSIGEEAFVSCSNLEIAVFPASLECVGQRAFWETSLVGIHIGTNLVEIGDNAFVTRGFLPGTSVPRPTMVEVDKDNPRYYVTDNLFCERGEAGDKALLFFGEAEEVHIPDRVAFIGDYCFRNAYIRELFVHDHVRASGQSSFAGISNLRFVHLVLPEPFQGRDEVTVRFPGTKNLSLLFTHALCMDKEGNFFDFEAYDQSIIHGRDATEMCAEVLLRYDCPYRLSDTMRKTFESSMSSVLSTACRNYIQTRNMEGFSRLADHGFINAENIDGLLAEARVDVSAEATAYLLDMKNRRFGIRDEDFEL